MNKRDTELFYFIRDNGEDSINIIKGKRTTRSLRYNLVKYNPKFITIFKDNEIDSGMEKIILTHGRTSNLRLIPRVSEETLRYVLTEKVVRPDDLRNLDFNHYSEDIIKFIIEKTEYTYLPDLYELFINKNLELTDEIIEIGLRRNTDIIEKLDNLNQDIILKALKYDISTFTIVDTKLIPYDIHKEIINLKGRYIKYSCYSDEPELQMLSLRDGDNANASNIEYIQNPCKEAYEFSFEIEPRETIVKIATKEIKLSDEELMECIRKEPTASLFFYNNIIKENYEMQKCCIESSCNVFPLFKEMRDKYKIEFSEEIKEIAVSKNYAVLKLIDNPSIKIQNIAVENAGVMKKHALFLIISNINKNNIKEYSQDVIDLLVDLPEAARFNFRKEFKENKKYKLGRLNQNL